MANEEIALSRTRQAELLVERFLGLPLVSEFVFRAPQTIDTTQKEVVDFLISCGPINLLISQKCQGDPSSRSTAKTEAWARKKTVEAVAQVCGALKPRPGKAVWCDHPRRGRVEFGRGLPPIDHAIVVTEVYQSVDLNFRASHLPLSAHGVGVSYFSLNDFLNIAVELRTVPEILVYLQARQVLPDSELRHIGDERSLFAYYLFNDGQFPEGTTRTIARQRTQADLSEIERRLRAKAERDGLGKLIEYVADQLATRSPTYAQGLSADTQARFEPDAARVAYLDMQTALADTRLSERGELGAALARVIAQTRANGQDFGYLVAYLDTKTDWVFVFASSQSLEREIALTRLQTLSAGALAHFDRAHCIGILDRDGDGFEAIIEHAQADPTPAAISIGKVLFGGFRMTSRPLPLVPGAAETRA